MSGRHRWPATRYRQLVLAYWRPVLAPALVVWAMATLLTSVLRLSNGDLLEYRAYALTALHSHGAHGLPAEYPAPALLVFMAPLLLPLPYTFSFCLLTGVALGALLFGFTDAETRGFDVAAARRLIVYLAVGTVMFLTARFDLFAVAAAFLALRSARRERWSAAWGWSSVGFLLKLFPAVLWPAFLIAEWRAAGRFPWRRLTWGACSLAVVSGVPAMLEPGSAFNALHYYLHRPTEIGSLGAGLSLLMDRHAWHYVASFHSVNATGPVVGAVSTAITLVAACGCGATWWMQRSGRLGLEASVLLSLTFVVAGGKVFSVQYLLWLMPFWALERQRVSWVSAALVTTAVFPYTAWVMSIAHVATSKYVTGLVLAYFLRDVLVVGGTVAWLRETLSRPIHGSSDLCIGQRAEPILAGGR
jgi:hypothetical protein